ncbi:MAG: Tad domain-containing protein [Candidatus Nanopelagicales bacterium]
MKNDEGSIMLLGIGMIGVCLLALAVITDSASAFIQQRELQSVADSIALAGAQGIDLEEYYEVGATRSTRLNSSQAEEIAKAHAAAMTADSDTKLTGVAVEPDGRSIRVTLTAPLRLTFFDALPFDPVQVSASARLDYAP